MIKEKIVTKTLTGASTEFEFDGLNVKEFLVKNFSDGDVYASFDPIDGSNPGMRIPTMTAQVCVCNLALCALDNIGSESIYVKGTGDVEVQAIWY